MTIAHLPAPLGKSAPARPFQTTGFRWLRRAGSFLGAWFTDKKFGALARDRVAYWNVDAAILMAGCAAQCGEWNLVESELAGGGRMALNDARCVNLLGLAAECRGDWATARRMYYRAARLDRSYLPARLNMRRYYELFTFGRSTVPLCWE